MHLSFLTLKLHLVKGFRMPPRPSLYIHSTYLRPLTNGSRNRQCAKNVPSPNQWKMAGGLSQWWVKDCLKVEYLLTSAIWSYGHEAEVYIFLNLPFPSNPKENSSIRCILSTPEQNLLWHIIGCTPNTFHNTINKNVNHSNDTIDNLNQSSFHKPACQCQGHLRTESLSASAHILHCGKIRPWVVRSGFRCASADLRQSRYLHVAR